MPVNPLKAAKRPSEAMRAYVESGFLNAGDGQKIRLPTIKEFSQHLKISTTTARTVLKKLATEGLLEMIPGKGTFLLPQTESQRPTRFNCLGINMNQAVIEDWEGLIYLGATSQALKEGMSLTALTELREHNPLTMQAALLRVDALIAFPDRGHGHEMDRLCAENKIPVVHINPAGFKTTTNFVSNDFFEFCYHLGLAWIRAGRRKIVLLCAGALNESVSAAQTHAAFSLAAMTCREARLEFAGNQVYGESPPQNASRKMGYSLMKEFLEARGPGCVDAVYGFGDFLAEGGAQALLDAGYKIPEEVSVVGGTGLKPISLACGNLVTMRQPMREIGGAAATMAIARIRNHGADAPGRYLMPTLGEGATLRAEERKAFQNLLTQEKELV